eukprot:TRINITY_DN47067_c0_g1_i1.p1 TRINITY_DN47067_c0_g1~~TRINITY_DN47067_c0_g1_i1.p1  ORF type:complete len:174 (+),score=40.61 TRINITY_DN47067_c0_g1_i1:48-569(+)
MRVMSVLLSLCVVASAEVKNNWMYFESNASVVANFSLGYYAVTKGEKWEGVSVDGNGVLVRCGNKKSAEVAAEFVDGIDVVNVIVTQHGIEPLPHELHFAVFGNLTLTTNQKTYTCTNFRMGQGHFTDYDNWWLGSTKCEVTPTTHKMTCVCDGGKLEFHSEDKKDKIVVLPA